MTRTRSEIDQLSINTIRMLAIDAVEHANSGHPGMPLGASPMAYTLWTRILRQNSANPKWFNRDRFVLSAGHGSMMLYSLLHLSGFDVSIEDIKQFRRWNSKTPGHPEFGHTEGVEATTGPLGQGMAMSVGMALTERFLAAVYNRPDYEIINHHTYALCGDGDLMEGVSQEAASIAGHLKLGQLIVLYDSNSITLDGETDLSFTEDVKLRFQAYGWQVLQVQDGNDPDAIEAAILEAKQDKGRPTLIEINTVIGHGSPNKGGKSASHGSPLGSSEVKLVREFYNWTHEPFHVPEEVRDHFLQLNKHGIQAEEEWNQLWEQYSQAYPELADQLRLAIDGKLPANWDKHLPVYSPDHKPIATRQASEDILNALGDTLPNLLGGSADLASSNKTLLKQSPNYSPKQYEGRNIWYGVREFAMGAIMNGILLHGGARAYGGTFLVFSDYMRPAMRLSALMGQPVIYVFTHDSIAYGEDGPTHQPIEHIPSLRLIPNMLVVRPADANETAAAYRLALSQHDRPVSLILSRQDLPVLPGTAEHADQLSNGAYVLADAEHGEPDLILIASGSEVNLSLQIREQLSQRGLGVRVVSMPCRELFDLQSQAYKDTVLLPSVVKRVALEMAHPSGWERYVGFQGLTFGIDRFGASAPGDHMIEQFGFTASRLVPQIEAYMKK
ncbi:transketolase [Cohnella boryungensis]|uniref:Transketolase n=1 Tax=Cohnella boryungensis TaxID=768479 RepID=A0ABV8S6F3_9BACL